jgi:hypothetical protein
MNRRPIYGSADLFACRSSSASQRMNAAPWLTINTASEIGGWLGSSAPGSCLLLEGVFSTSQTVYLDHEDNQRNSYVSDVCPVGMFNKQLQLCTFEIHHGKFTSYKAFHLPRGPMESLGLPMDRFVELIDSIGML